MDGAFPGRSYNARGFRVQWDSKVREHSYKVFCTVQFKGTHTGVLNFGRPIPPTGKAVVGALEVMSFTFNTAGLCSRITAEYVTDKSVGNTGGWGGMYGIMHAIGKPIPEPWTIGGKLCAAFPPLLGFTSTMGLWILNGVLLGAAVTGGTKAPPSKPPPLRRRRPRLPSLAALSPPPKLLLLPPLHPLRQHPPPPPPPSPLLPLPLLKLRPPPPLLPPPPLPLQPPRRHPLLPSDNSEREGGDGTTFIKWAKVVKLIKSSSGP